MAECSECEESVSMPFSCKFCGQSFCSSHRLPENHDCGGLEEYRAKSKEESDEITYDIQRKEKEYEEGKGHEQQEEQGAGLLDRVNETLDRVKQKAWSVKGTVERKLSGSSRGQRQARAGMGARRQRSPVTGAMQQAFPEIGTFVLLGAIFVAFLVQNAVGLRVSLMEYGLIADVIATEPWRIVTSMFMHSGTAHLLVNGMVLFFFGAELEKRIGTGSFLRLYAVAGVVAAAGYLGFAYLTGNTGVPAVGASGALYGVFAALAMIAPEIRVLAFFIIPMKIRTALVGFALLDIFLLTRSVPIASAAHLAGLAVGLVYGYRMKDRVQKRFDMFSL